MTDLLEIIRQRRNLLLNATDKYVSVPDYPITAEQKIGLMNYRQQLRELPQTVNVEEYNSENVLNCFPTQPNYVNLCPF